MSDLGISPEFEEWLAQQGNATPSAVGKAGVVSPASRKAERPLAAALSSEQLEMGTETTTTVPPPTAEERSPDVPTSTSDAFPPSEALPARAPGTDPEEHVSVSEIIQHAAVDSVFFSSHFFPDTFRQASPGFHREVWELLDDPLARYINIQMFRGAGKTTLLRTYIAKRLAYGLSRTILYLGASEAKATDSILWVKGKIERSKEFAKTFGLEKGKPWTNERVQVLHALEGYGIYVLAMGITGSVRGLNIDDYRPDLIIVDDVIAEENSATPDGRKKIAELILGAVKESLAPASEVPDAKLVIINTPQDFDDLSQKALTDSEFRSARFGCWTPETENLPLEFQESIWPERWSSEVLRKEKAAAIDRNMLSTFAREKECLLVTPETSSFREEWIRYYGEDEGTKLPPLHEMWIEYSIDPVPPPSDIQIAKGNINKDFEAHVVAGRHKGKYYILEVVSHRGHEPDWTVATFFELCSRWRPRKVIVETVAYQKVLEWLLKKAMQKTGRYVPLMPFNDRRKKIDRIRQSLKGPLSENAIYFRREQKTLVSQVIHYPGKNPLGTYDDEIDATSVVLESLQTGEVGDIEDDEMYEKQMPEPKALVYRRGAP